MCKYHVFFVSALLAAAATAQDVALEIASVDGVGMQQVTVPISIVGGATPPATLILDVTYQDLIFRPAGVNAGAAALAASKGVSSSVVAPGVLRVIVSGLNQNTMSPGIVANVAFDVIPLTDTKMATNSSALGAPGVSAAAGDASALSGSMPSSMGSATAVPRPRRTVRRESFMRL